MTKSEERRSDILERLADYVLAEGLSASSLRALAKAANTSDRMLLYYFKDKGEIITATLGVIGDRLESILTQRTSSRPLPLEQLKLRLLKIVQDDALWPYMRMWLEISAFAAQGDAFYRSVGRHLGEQFLDWGARQLESGTPRNRKADAAALLLTIEGVLLLKSVGMDGAIKDAMSRT